MALRLGALDKVSLEADEKTELEREKQVRARDQKKKEKKPLNYLFKFNFVYTVAAIGAGRVSRNNEAVWVVANRSIILKYDLVVVFFRCAVWRGSVCGSAPTTI